MRKWGTTIFFADVSVSKKCTKPQNFCECFTKFGGGVVFLTQTKLSSIISPFGDLVWPRDMLVMIQTLAKTVFNEKTVFTNAHYNLAPPALPCCGLIKLNKKFECSTFCGIKPKIEYLLKPVLLILSFADAKLINKQ